MIVIVCVTNSVSNITYKSFFYHIIYDISCLCIWYEKLWKSRRIPPLNTHCLENSAESEERSLLKTMFSLTTLLDARYNGKLNKKKLSCLLSAIINAMLIDSVPTRRNEIYIFFLFSRSGIKAKNGVEFRHWTRNTSRIRRKVGNGSVLKGNEVS